MTDGTASDVTARAGRYVRQPAGYRAFIPAGLPPNPPVVIDSELQTLLSDADRALGRLDGSIQTLPHPDLFVAMYIRKEAVLSSQIEGTQSSLQDVLRAEAKVFSSDQPNDVDEVFNYVRAMNYGLARLTDLPVSIRLIREIHERLLAGVRGGQLAPGELRTSQNWIGPSGSTIMDASFVPPPPDVVPEALGNLEKFIHGTQPLPMLVRIGIAHAQLETIHPFLDGNGRVGRLMIALLLSEWRVLQKPVLYLSHYFKKHRQRYYESLQTVRDTGDWEQWLHFFLTGIVEVSGEATITARKILHLRETHRDLVTRELGRSAANGHQVLESLFEHPIMSVTDVKDLIGITYTAANDLVGRFERMDLLQETTGNQRNRRFIYRPYVELFYDQ
jgi:Fic family protein